MKKKHPVALSTAITEPENDSFSSFVDQCAAQSPETEERAAASATRQEKALTIVNQHVLAASIAGAIPSPLVDLSAVTAINLDLIRRLAGLYDIPFRESLGRNLLAGLTGGLLPVCGAPVVASFLKFVPVVGTLLGFLSVSTMAAATTYATGRVFIMHFASGGTLLDFDPQAMHAYYKKMYQAAPPLVNRSEES